MADGTAHFPVVPLLKCKFNALYQNLTKEQASILLLHGAPPDETRGLRQTARAFEGVFRTSILFLLVFLLEGLA